MALSYTMRRNDYPVPVVDFKGAIGSRAPSLEGRQPPLRASLEYCLFIFRLKLTNKVYSILLFNSEYSNLHWEVITERCMYLVLALVS